MEYPHFTDREVKHWETMGTSTSEVCFPVPVDISTLALFVLVPKNSHVPAGGGSG